MKVDPFVMTNSHLSETGQGICGCAFTDLLNENRRLLKTVLYYHLNDIGIEIPAVNFNNTGVTLIQRLDFQRRKLSFSTICA